MMRVSIVATLVLGAWSYTGSRQMAVAAAADPEAVPAALQETSQRRTQMEAYRREGLAAAAAVTGEFVIDVGAPAAGGPATLGELVQNSECILVGRVLSNRMRPSKDGRQVRTLYSVKNEGVIKGPCAAELLVISVAGGKVTFADGSSAVARNPGFIPPMNESTYLWFVRRAAPDVVERPADQIDPATFMHLAEAHLGVFDVSSPGDLARPRGYLDSPVSRAIMSKGLSQAGLVAAVRTLAASAK